MNQPGEVGRIHLTLYFTNHENMTYMAYKKDFFLCIQNDFAKLGDFTMWAKVLLENDYSIRGWWQEDSSH